MIAEPQHIPLSEAWLCLDCTSIGNSGSCCPRCGSVQLHPVQAWLDRKVKTSK